MLVMSDARRTLLVAGVDHLIRAGWPLAVRFRSFQTVETEFTDDEQVAVGVFLRPRR